MQYNRFLYAHRLSNLSFLLAKRLPNNHPLPRYRLFSGKMCVAAREHGSAVQTVTPLLAIQTFEREKVCRCTKDSPMTGKPSAIHGFIPKRVCRCKGTGFCCPNRHTPARDTNYLTGKGVSRHERQPNDRKAVRDTRFHAEKSVSLHEKQPYARKQVRGTELAQGYHRIINGKSTKKSSSQKRRSTPSYRNGYRRFRHDRQPAISSGGDLCGHGRNLQRQPSPLHADGVSGFWTDRPFPLLPSGRRG